jgi:glutamate/tyrosine decarboxylase-like PLP-dependent enzyme
VDSLASVAEIAEEFDLWFHVDGAYGAPGALDPHKQSLFTGLNRADSVSLDPHKWFYTPIDCGCLLFRDPERARAAFSSGEVDYIKVHEQSDAESFAFWDYGIELSRRFRALKVWFTFKYYGVQRLAASITEDNELAQYLGAQVEAADDFELLAPVELSICCFRYVPIALRRRLAAASGDEAEQLNAGIDDLNGRIMHTVQRGGRAYFSSATLRGRFALRMCIVNFRTTRSNLDQTLEIIRETAENLGDLR